MKRLSYLVKSLAAIAIVLLFTQCANKTENHTQTTATATAAISGGELKIAYVDIDSLLTKYNFCIDLNEAMVKKEENIRLTLNQKAAQLKKDGEEFQRKYENNAFISPERAQQEYNRLEKAQADLQNLSNKLSNELATETAKNNLQLRDSINTFIQAFNKIHGYSLIISNTGFDNLLYADPSMDITNEIVDGLNARYNSSSKK